MCSVYGVININRNNNADVRKSILTAYVIKRLETGLDRERGISILVAGVKRRIESFGRLIRERVV